jgi:hypothetical protein
MEVVAQWLERILFFLPQIIGLLPRRRQQR